MLRANGETGDIYGFLGEGGYVSFENVNSVTGEAVLVVHGEKDITKREFVFGQQEVAFSFLPEEIERLGEGDHKYTLYTKDTSGVKNTLIPDRAHSMSPVFHIE